MKSEKIISLLKEMGSKRNIEGMARFGINTERAFGVSNKDLRELAQEVKREVKDPAERHKLALQLWDQGYHEAMILAAFIDVAEMVTEGQMDGWVSDFRSWAVCDSVLGHLLDKTPFVYDKIRQYVKDEREFVRRAGFALIAWRAVHDKGESDDTFVSLLALVKDGAHDDRNYVKKAVNWALRQIGKRNDKLRQKALEVSADLLRMNSKTARWIAKDAIRELNNK